MKKIENLRLYRNIPTVITYYLLLITYFIFFLYDSNRD